MLSPPFPEKMFFFKVLIINERTLSWAAINFLFISINPPSSSYFQMSLSKKSEKTGSIFFLYAEFIIPVGWRTFRYYFGRITKPSSLV